MGRGTNLFHALRCVPPGEATAPSRALMRKSVRDTCQPPRLPAAAERQLCVDRAVPAPATISVISRMTSADTPDSAAANSGVYSAYSVERISSNASKVSGAPGWTARRYSFQFHQRRTKSRLYRLVAMRWCATASMIAASEPGKGESQWSAWVAVFDSRVSRTMSLAPLALASMIRWACGLK
jgi:hypothetical protein